MSFIEDFLALFYPKVCCGCSKSLLKGENGICLECKMMLPTVPIHSLQNNQISKVLWGRVKIRDSFSLVEFNKGHRIQKILHAIKYENNPIAANELGRMMGESIEQLGGHYDSIVPVPLHPKRQKIRGYNQAEEIANGLAEVLHIHVETRACERVAYNKTQTNKGRLDRWENVEEIFELKQPDLLLEHDVLVVDDVLTTGATLEAFTAQLLSGPCKSVSIATAACVL